MRIDRLLAEPTAPPAPSKRDEDWECIANWLRGDAFAPTIASFGTASDVRVLRNAILHIARHVGLETP